MRDPCEGISPRLRWLLSKGKLHSMTAKAEVLEIVQKLPETASYDEIAQRIELLAGIREAQEEIKRGEGIPLEDVLREIPSWVTTS